MPINRLIKDSKLDAKRAAVLTCAFEHALRELGLADRVDALTEIVAGKIIEVGATEIDDPKEIAGAAIKRLGLPDASRSRRCPDLRFAGRNVTIAKCET